jgi:anti-anti-sigma factor
MLIETAPSMTEIMITLPNRFDFKLHQAFQNSYEPALLSHAFKSICLNMSAVEFIDGAALGMLLALKQASRTAHIDLIIKDCKEEIANLLEAAGLNDIHELQYHLYAEGKPHTVSEFHEIQSLRYIKTAL